MIEGKRAILIVDDVAMNRSVLGRRFERRGYHITYAECGTRALQLVQEHPFDLVLLDVMMPDLDGITVLKRIRQQHSLTSLPVIMVTAKAESEDVAAALEAGANDYVTKPVDFVVAHARVVAQLGRKQAEEAMLRANESLLQMNEDLERRVAERTAELVSTNDALRSEMAERERFQAETHYIAHHDALTGLGNRVLFRQQLNEALAQVGRSGGDLALLFIDLDGFKGINDTLGHSIGDALLRSIATRLRESLRDSDLVARLGGDEFAIVQTSGAQPDGAADLAGRVIELLSKPCLVDGHQLVVGASVGIAVAHARNSDAEKLLRSADLAMYRAKADGRGIYRFFEPGMDARAQARRTMELDLRQAMTANELELYYQPLFDLERGCVSGFEALLRWKHPRRGFVLPSEFIPVAEEIGMIVPLGDWVLRQACLEAIRWPNDILLAVNLSPVQFRYDGLIDSIFGALKMSGLPAQRLELEITESLFLDKTDANVKILNELRRCGVRISLDDFGTGYSSLSYLRAFQFDKIKIDKSFVRDLAEKRDSLAIVRAVADIGVSFGITTTAEGVETDEQLAFLKEEGYTEVQGFLFGQPCPASDIPMVLAKTAQRLLRPTDRVEEDANQPVRRIAS